MLIVLLSDLAQTAMASPPIGIGGVATNLLEPVAYLSDFIYTACFVIGGSFLFASIIKYVEHCRNPLAVPIGTVVFLLVAGLALLSLPFAYLAVHHGMPYTLMR
ncbi:MAG: hypothetical protein ACD_45C00259G0003 [uncultured bacterium]|nr:MAG: hypothetical protein ACD_45C00259G0003 [uncultured bacterium]